MGSYLETYRAGEAGREKKIRWALLGLLLAAIVALILYFQLRNLDEERQVQTFLGHLKTGNYRAGYALWGCTEQNPCPSYKYERFLEDWGPKSAYAGIAAVKLGETKSCRAGIIQVLQMPSQPDVLLWVERSTLTLGFAPWPVCNPRMAAGQSGK